MAAMGLNTEEQGSAMAFFRRGYRVRLHHLLMASAGVRVIHVTGCSLGVRDCCAERLLPSQTSTWWEDAVEEEQSSNWRR